MMKNYYGQTFKLGLVFLVMLALAMMLAGKAEAENDDYGRFYTGNKLLSKCEEPAGAIRGVCLGYIIGIFDSLEVFKVLYPNIYSGTSICTKIYNYSELTTGQIERIVIKYLNDHPEDLHHPAGGIILWALSEAFPCPAKGSQ